MWTCELNALTERGAKMWESKWNTSHHLSSILIDSILILSISNVRSKCLRLATLFLRHTLGTFEWNHILNWANALLNIQLNVVEWWVKCVWQFVRDLHPILFVRPVIRSHNQSEFEYFLTGHINVRCPCALRIYSYSYNTKSCCCCCCSKRADGNPCELRCDKNVNKTNKIIYVYGSSFHVNEYDRNDEIDQMKWLHRRPNVTPCHNVYAYCTHNKHG